MLFSLPSLEVKQYEFFFDRIFHYIVRFRFDFRGSLCLLPLIIKKSKIVKYNFGEFENGGTNMVPEMLRSRIEWPKPTIEKFGTI